MLTFFTDRDLGKRFSAILREAGLNVELLDDHFRNDTPDPEWLEVVAAREWIVVTRDRRIRYKPNEIAAVQRHGVRMLVLVGKASFPDLAHSFVATVGRIERFVESHQAPWIAKVYRATESERTARPDAPGSVERWYPR